MMMLRHADFSLDEEARALREAFSSLLTRECPPERVRAAEPGGFDEKLWRAFVEMRTSGGSLEDAYLRIVADE